MPTPHAYREGDVVDVDTDFPLGAALIFADRVTIDRLTGHDESGTMPQYLVSEYDSGPFWVVRERDLVAPSATVFR